MTGVKHQARLSEVRDNIVANQEHFLETICIVNEACECVVAKGTPPDMQAACVY